jgi:hypothetical protein
MPFAAEQDRPTSMWQSFLGRKSTNEGRTGLLLAHVIRSDQIGS